MTIMLKYSKQETYIEFAEFSTEFHRSESVLIKTIIPHDPFQHFEVATTQPVTTLVNHLYTDHQLSTSILAHLSTVSITAQQHNKSVIKTNTEREGYRRPNNNSECNAVYVIFKAFFIISTATQEIRKCDDNDCDHIKTINMSYLKDQPNNL